MTGPLHGVKVVDLSSVVVGPICTRSLADQGAEVIKVESPQGDLLRTLAKGRRGAAMSGKFIQFNRNKTSSSRTCARMLSNAFVSMRKP